MLRALQPPSGVYACIGQTNYQAFNQMKNNILLGILLAVLLTTACHRQATEDQDAALRREGDTVFVATTSPLFHKLVVDTLRATDYSAGFVTVGTVRPVAGSYAEVGVPADGRTTEACVRLGQRVAAGQRLFGFRSPDFAEAARSYTEARSRAEAARRNYDRKRELNRAGVASERELDEARVSADETQAELHAAADALGALGLSTREIGQGQFYVTSPIAGEVVAMEVVRGQYVRADAEPLVRVADLSRVWVSAKLKEYYADAVSEQDSVAVSLDTDSDLTLQGRIYYVGRLIDERNRSLEVLVECNNRDGRLRPGMFVRVRFHSQPRPELLLPAEAVLQAGSSSYVLEEARPGVYVRRAVRVESADEGRVRVLSGLTAGARIVCQGAIYLAQ